MIDELNEPKLFIFYCLASALHSISSAGFFMQQWWSNQLHVATREGRPRDILRLGLDSRPFYLRDCAGGVASLKRAARVAQ
jgi:hypothetical protein